MSKFHLDIIASDKIFYKGDAEMVVIPSIDGEQGILADHQPMVVAVEIGELRILVDGIWHKAVVGGGMAQIMNNTVTLLLDSVEKPEDIDIRRAEESKQRAEEQLRQKQSLLQYHQSKAALSRAMSRLSVARKNSKL